MHLTVLTKKNKTKAKQRQASNREQLKEELRGTPYILKGVCESRGSIKNSEGDSEQIDFQALWNQKQLATFFLLLS